MTKTDQALALIAAGQVKEGLKIFSTFKLGLTKEQCGKLKTGYECLVHPEFYKQLKVDVDQAVAEALMICNQFHKEEVQ